MGQGGPPRQTETQRDTEVEGDKTQRDRQMREAERKKQRENGESDGKGVLNDYRLGR